MRRNGYSRAYYDFQKEVERAIVLMRIEKRLYKDPPKSEEVVAVEALRLSATVLLVASFEKYLRDSMEEFVEFLGSHANSTSHSNLPRDFCRKNDINYVEWVVKDSRWQKERKHLELKRVAPLIHGGKFLPESFNRTRANPGVETIKNLLRDYGINDPFTRIDTILPKHYEIPINLGSSESNITTIITKRNQVAHGGSSLNIARGELMHWTKFMKGVAKSIDNLLRDHTFAVISSL